MFNPLLRQPKTLPFPYYALNKVFTHEASLEILKWLESEAPWRLRVAEFYEQYEFSFADLELPANIKEIFSTSALKKITSELEEAFDTKLSNCIDLTAHKLIPGQKIKVHNDFIPGQESHRILIQLNRGWSKENGGILFFYNSEDANDIHAAFLPAHNTSVVFEISPRSFHAVSTITASERYTLVLSFYRTADGS